MRSQLGLRFQLLLGLGIIIFAATISVGAITVWATRWRVTRHQVSYGQMLGEALSKVLALRLAVTEEENRSLEEFVADFGADAGILEIDIADIHKKILFSSHRPQRSKSEDGLLSQALNTQQQVIQALEGSERLVVCTPLTSHGTQLGVLRIVVPLIPEKLEWPFLFWVLMSIDGLMIVLFVGYVLTRYVIHPVELMEQAAHQVTRGDLDVRLPEEGANELSSLAASFNSMTDSVKSQLERLKAQQEEIAAKSEQLIRSEKLASVGRLAAGIAHEVGNPLQSLMGFTDMLLKGGGDEETQMDFLTRISSETQRIHQIIRELLDYARPFKEAIEKVHLNAVVEQAIQLVKPQKRLRQVSVTVSGLESLPPVVANTQRLVQVLVNLLLNAGDAMNGNGEIVFRGSASEGSQLVELHMANSGPLIPVEDRPHIFDPFFTTKEPGQGTGLGLSVAQSIIESFDGKLRLVDAPQTTFLLSLPKAHT